MTNLLFVYGSLMPELKTPFGVEQRTRLAAESKVLGPATLAATLYDLGDYPGVLMSTDGRAVHGTLLHLEDPSRTFLWLDPFEDIVHGRDPALAEYQRSIQNVDSVERLERGRYSAWVYVLRRVPPAALIVASGIWHAPSP